MKFHMLQTIGLRELFPGEKEFVQTLLSEDEFFLLIEGSRLDDPSYGHKVLVPVQKVREQGSKIAKAIGREDLLPRLAFLPKSTFVDLRE